MNGRCLACGDVDYYATHVHARCGQCFSTDIDWIGDAPPEAIDDPPATLPPIPETSWDELEVSFDLLHDR
jgi:hypothetical protein